MRLSIFPDLIFTPVKGVNTTEDIQDWFNRSFCSGDWKRN